MYRQYGINLPGAFQAMLVTRLSKGLCLIFLLTRKESNMKKFYNLSKEDILNNFDSSIENGLSLNEVKLRQNEYGYNELITEKTSSIFIKFIDQLKDFMIVVLFVAAIVSSLTGDLIEGIFIILIVLLNAILGVIQEQKAEKSLESIKKLSSPHIIVLRDNSEYEIDVKDLVVGDIVLLNAGDFVPADVRILKSNNLKVDESTLTGESVPVNKNSETLKSDNVSLGDQTNMAFMSTVVTYGTGLAIVCRIGMDTEIGKITSMLNDSKKSLTPLQKNINQLGKILALIALAITALIFVIDIVETLIIFKKLSFSEIKDSFTFAVALAVAAIPEGLPAIITVVLSLGMTNLVKQNAIMRNLPSVETLGSTNIICSDKTGTLTLNQMTITKVYTNSTLYDLNENYDKDELNKLINFSNLATDVKLRYEDNNLLKFGDPTEISLINLAINNGLDPIKIKEENERIYEFPFDSKRKLMSSINKIDNQTYAIVKGAPDVLFNLLSKYDHDGKIKDINNDYIANLNHINDELSDQALRVIAIAYKKVNESEKYIMEEIENDLTFLGLVAMIDPERDEAKDAILKCKTAGITTVMITGDHIKTAKAIAKNIGIIENDFDKAITGKELDKLNDDEFLNIIEDIKVYARVSPENKVRIVKAWQSLDKVVAMTGDGVNDAPSIKTADIGIAMGITGTEVAKDSADMILTDDNFATIVNAVGEGRGIYANIKKAIHFLLSCNIGEILVMFLGVSLGVFIFKGASFNGHILTAIQILWVNLVTDSLMAIALGLEHREPNVMEMMPRDSKKSIFSDGLAKTIILQGLMVGLLTFIAFTIGWFYYPKGDRVLSARTMAFMVLSLSQLFHAFNVRSIKYSTFKLKVNKPLIYAFITSFILQMIVMLTPGIRKIFNVGTFSFLQFIIILLLSMFQLLLMETIKYFKNK